MKRLNRNYINLINNPSDNILEEIQDFPYNKILKESLSNKKEENPFYMSFIPLLKI